MGRPLRIEFPGAIYHITSRGDRQEPIFKDDVDREMLLDVVDRAMGRLDAEAFAFCLMGNHYHFVVHTRQANLSRLMRHINGEYTRAFNRRHGVTGHLFQGRFNSVLVDSDAYLIEVCRYVELNPVRAGLVRLVEHWPWSSFRANSGQADRRAWLATSVLHGYLLGFDATTEEHRLQAARLYAEAVHSALHVDLWKEHLRAEIYLGDEDFVLRTKARATQQRLKCAEISRTQRSAPQALATWLVPGRNRDEAFRLAYSAGGMTMGQIAREAAMSVSAVSRMIASAEGLQHSRPDTATFKT